ncbi:MAG TPA: hypothetical protein VIL27_02035 [Clostridia bacterium]
MGIGVGIGVGVDVGNGVSEAVGRPVDGKLEYDGSDTGAVLLTHDAVTNKTHRQNRIVRKRQVAFTTVRGSRMGILVI